MLDYIYDMEAEQYSFVRVPKILLQHETYQRISSEAKLLYSLLLDRVGISLRSGWKDKQDRVYIIYPIAEIMEEMNCGKNKAVQLLDELEQKAGLIERKRQGLGKPNLIYVKSFYRTVDNSGERHFLNFENKTSGSPKTKPPEVSESNSINTDSKKTYKNDFKHNQEYGSARWGTHADIEPFMDPKFENNVILTATERLTMSNRPKNPATARNKNVLIVGGSGSGKTRFWLKPNLLQMHSSYVVTDPNR